MNGHPFFKGSDLFRYWRVSTCTRQATLSLLNQTFCLSIVLWWTSYVPRSCIGNHVWLIFLIYITLLDRNYCLFIILCWTCLFRDVIWAKLFDWLHLYVWPSIVHVRNLFSEFNLPIFEPYKPSPFFLFFISFYIDMWSGCINLLSFPIIFLRVSCRHMRHRLMEFNLYPYWTPLTIFIYSLGFGLTGLSFNVVWLSRERLTDFPSVKSGHIWGEGPNCFDVGSIILREFHLASCIVNILRIHL